MSGLFNSLDHLAILPPLILALFGCALLLLPFVAGRESRWSFWLTALGLAFTAAALTKQGMWLSETGSQAITGFSGAVAVDRFAVYFNWLFTMSSLLVALMSRERRPEYFALLLFSQCGMFFLAAGAELITLFIGLELMSICFYVLVGFNGNSARSLEAAIKYLLLGGFSSALLAYGFSLLFGLSGSTLLRDIEGAVNARPQDALLLVAVPVIVAALLFKVSAAPFHMWAPDAYEGAPTAITAYLSVASKAASVALAMRLLPGALQAASAVWIPLLIGAAVLTLVIGNFAALTQNNLKRLLAYSSIGHVGFMLLALVAGNETGRAGLAVYLLVYGISNVGAFAIAIALERGNGFGSDVSALAGLMRRSPGYALAMLLFLLSLAGIPPAAGFWGKYYITLALIQSGHYALAGVAAVFIAISCVYYFRLVRFLFLQSGVDAERPYARPGLQVALVTSSAITLAAGFFPEPFLRFAAGAMK